jgi:hypothetical protein
MPWELDEYRNIYATAVVEATGAEGDGKYALKSHIYEAVHAALYRGSNGGRVNDICTKLLRKMSCTQLLGELDVLLHLGQGWGQGEWRVNKELRHLVAPEHPT